MTVDQDRALAAPPQSPPFSVRRLVSVLVRSMGRSSLQGALDSIAAQRYPEIEVVLVNASGRAHPALPAHCGPHPLRLIEPGVALARAAAANRALQEARGAWLLFLDDDDLIDPDHIERLRAALERRPLARVAYAGVRLLGADGVPTGTLDEPFDAGRLWLANYLPIHAVMFSRALLDEGYSFDESMPVYEDWDFWHQIARRHGFVHVPGVSASYRMAGHSELSAEPDVERSRQLRRGFYRKWVPRLTGDEAERVAAAAELARGQARDGLAAAAEARAAMVGLQQQALVLDARLQESRAAHEALGRTLVHEQQRHERDRLRAEHLAEQLQRHGDDLRAAHAAYRELEQGYRAVTQSMSWRVTAPLRRLRGAAARLERRALLRRVLRALPVSAAGKQRVKVWLAQHRWGGRLLRLIAPASVGVGTTPAPAPLDKEAVRADAEIRLTSFLNGNERLLLSQGAAKPAVTVVVVLFNQAGLSCLCLQALASSRGVAFETLIVDNASSDRVPQLLERIDGATVLRPGSNLGFLRAVNLAAPQARGQYLLLLNNDALVEPDTLRHAVARLDADPAVAAVGGPILWWDGRLQEAGSIVWRDGSCTGYGRGDDPAKAEYRFVRDVDYCSGALLMCRREQFESLGRFDEAFAPAYYEESDFCARLWEAGQRVVYDPQVRVRHFEFASEVAKGQAIALQQRNRALFVGRHGEFLSARPEPAAGAELRARQRLRPGARRVLVIDDRVPLPWLGQGYPRAASLVAALAARGHFVTLYPLQFPNEPWEEVARALPETVEVMLHHGLIGLEAFLRARQGLYETVIVSRPHNMTVLRAVLQREPGLLSSARIVYDAEALFSLRDIAKAEVEGRPLTSAEQQRRISEEMALAQGAQAVVAVSELEAAHYRAAGYADVNVLGHTLSPDRATPGFDSRRGFLFVGALTADDTPNADSVLWFVREVWPRVVDALSADAQLHLVGQCDSARVRALAGPNVHLHGRSETLAPHFDAARVFIVPTRYAAGIAHKAHEAASRGLPMVTTALIAQQLGWADKVAVGSDAAAFAAECIALHRDAARWQRLRQGLFDAVARDCSPQAFERAANRLVEPAAPSIAVDKPANHAERLQQLRLLLQAQAAPAAATDPYGEARTAALWGRDAEQRASTLNAYRHWSSHPVTGAEVNRLVSGDPRVGWVAHLKRAWFAQPGRRGISLGCGGGAVVVDALQLHIVEQMEGVDISPAAVAVAMQRAADAGVAARAHFRVGNLNQIDLGNEPYDLILFEQSLHHVEALDAVLDTCARALAPGGLFVINEYVGPDRFQWSDETERLMNELLRLLPESHREDPASGAVKKMMQRTTPQQVIDVDPSEAVHSSDILAACGARFELVERRDFGGTLLQFMLAEIVANFDPDDERDAALLRLLTMLEMEMIRAGALASDFVYAVYRPLARSAPTRTPADIDMSFCAYD